MPPAAKVLIVDDEPLIRWSLSEALADHGFEVQVASDGLSRPSSGRPRHPDDCLRAPEMTASTGRCVPSGDEGRP
jgi:DNA-binding response OmpR family regulator